MNCWLWLILLWSAFGGRGRSCGDCGCRDSRDYGCKGGRGGKPSFAGPVSSGNGCGCGCDDDIMPSRGFAGFGDGGTCGCEEKSDCKND